jgi:hypothetical protein
MKNKMIQIIKLAIQAAAYNVAGMVAVPLSLQTIAPNLDRKDEDQQSSAAGSHSSQTTVHDFRLIDCQCCTLVSMQLC